MESGSTCHFVRQYGKTKMFSPHLETYALYDAAELSTLKFLCLNTAGKPIKVSERFIYTKPTL